MTLKEKKTRREPDTQDLLRRFKTNPLIFIGTIAVLAIVIVAFVFVPAIVPSAAGTGMELVFGSYNKIPIAYTPGNYFAQIRDTLARNAALYGIGDNDVWRSAFEQAAVHTAIMEEIKKAGYAAPAGMVDKKVADMPQFKENGVFSLTRYRSLDKSARMTLWRQTKERMETEQYQKDLQNVRVSSQETAFIRAMGSPQRTFDFAAFSITDYPEEEIKAYIASRQNLFAVTHLSRITITSSEREARQVLDGIKAGTSTFEDAARTHSKDEHAEKGGDLGSRMAYEFIPDVPDEAEREGLMALPKGELSAVVGVPEGWAFFRAEEAPKNTADTEDKALLDRIFRSYIMEFERGQVENFFLGKAEAFAAEVRERGFDDAAAERGLEKRSFGPLPLNYGNTNLFNSVLTAPAPEVYRAGHLESFWQAAFSTPLLTPSAPLVVDTYVAVLYPTEETVLDERNAGYIDLAYSSLLNNYLTITHAYFLNHPRMEDRFIESYIKYFYPAN
ncbi:MAG: peptidylprolyl isomerase [Spirochaetaceae bacterium]|jgi:hypothetical protein|nr:peptidylprolyl isomerase [Spirochaetaceae bacterium]